MAGELAHYSRGIHIPALPLLGLPADGGVHEIIALRERESRARARLVAAGSIIMSTSLSGMKANSLMAVGVEFFAVVMRVGVDVHALTSSAYYTIAHPAPQGKSGPCPRGARVVE